MALSTWNIDHRRRMHGLRSTETASSSAQFNPESLYTLEEESIYTMGLLRRPSLPQVSPLFTDTWIPIRTGNGLILWRNARLYFSTPLEPAFRMEEPSLALQVDFATGDDTFAPSDECSSMLFTRPELWDSYNARFVDPSAPLPLADDMAIGEHLYSFNPSFPEWIGVESVGRPSTADLEDGHAAMNDTIQRDAVPDLSRQIDPRRSILSHPNEIPACEDLEEQMPPNPSASAASCYW